MDTNTNLTYVTNTAIELGIKDVQKAALAFQTVALTSRGYQFKTAFAMLGIKTAFDNLTKQTKDEVIIDGIKCKKWHEYVTARFNIGKSTAEAAVKVAKNFCLPSGEADEAKTHFLSYSCLNNFTSDQIEEAYKNFIKECLQEERATFIEARDSEKAADEDKKTAIALLDMTDEQLLAYIPTDGRSISFGESIDISFSRLAYKDIKRLVKGQPKPSIAGGTAEAEAEAETEAEAEAEAEIIEKETAEVRANKEIVQAIAVLSNNFKYMTEAQKQALRELLASKKSKK